MHPLKDLAKRAGHQLQSTLGYRLLRTKRWGVDWLDDCIRIAAEGWHPDFSSLDVIFDVGANTGQTARKLIQRTNPRQIVCFEPVASTFKQLQANTKHFAGVQTLNCGLSNQDGEGEINIYSSSVFASTCDSSPIWKDNAQQIQGKETIKLRSLDSICHDQGITLIDLLKVDTEGADLRALEGAQEMLANHRVGMIVFEFYCPTSCETQNGTFFPIDQYLRSHQYRLVSFYTDYVHQQQSTGIYNALYTLVPGAQALLPASNLPAGKVA